MRDIVAKLGNGDRRSIGKADEVVRDVLKNPALFAGLFAALLDEDPVVRMRASDAVEKVTRELPELLQPRKRQMLSTVAKLEGQELRWHVAQMLPRLRLTPIEREAAVEILMGYLEDTSSIVKTCSMQALADLAVQDRRLLGRVMPVIERLSRAGTPAMKSRGRKLLKQLRGLPGAE